MCRLAKKKQKTKKKQKQKNNVRKAETCLKTSSKIPETVKCVSGRRTDGTYYRRALIIGYSENTVPDHWGPRSKWAAWGLRGRPA